MEHVRSWRGWCFTLAKSSVTGDAPGYDGMPDGTSGFLGVQSSAQVGRGCTGEPRVAVTSRHCHVELWGSLEETPAQFLPVELDTKGCRAHAASVISHLHRPSPVGECAKNRERNWSTTVVCVEGVRCECERTRSHLWCVDPSGRSK